MPVTTPLDLISLALKQAGVVGVGQTPLAEDINDSFDVLNMMLAQWSKRRWMIGSLVDVTLTSTGAASYTWGAGGAINLERPASLADAFIRYNNIDTPLTVIRSREDYDRVPYKGLQGFPRGVFYDPTYPLGTVWVWPQPPAGYEVHLVVLQPLSEFASLTDTINLPAEYQEAILYNLDGRLRPMYQKPPDPTVTALAHASLNTIMNANAAVPLLQMPAALRGPGWFNIYTGDYA